MRLLVILLGFHLSLSAQDSSRMLQVTPTVKNIGIGSNPCYEVVIPENTVAEVEKGFREWMKGYDAKVSTVKGEIVADNALMKEFGSRVTDIYARFEKVSAKETRLVIAFDIAGKFINETDFPSEHVKARDLVYAFALKQYKAGIQKLIDAEQKKKEKMEGRQANLEKDIESSRKEIERLKERIKKAEAEIDLNHGRVEEQKVEIEQQKKKIAALEEKLRNAR